MRGLNERSGRCMSDDIEQAQQGLEHAHEANAAHPTHNDRGARRVAVLISALAAALAIAEMQEKGAQLVGGVQQPLADRPARPGSGGRTPAAAAEGGPPTKESRPPPAGLPGQAGVARESSHRLGPTARSPPCRARGLPI